MPATMSALDRARHRLNGDPRPRMAKAVLTESENVEFRATLRLIGECLDEARRYVGWTNERLAQELKRDPKQVGRWMTGEERTQVDVVWTVPLLRQPFIVAMAKRASCEIETVVRVRIA
jgi:ribosome-binding protein aMBF1 (putative translation factor)